MVFKLRKEIIAYVTPGGGWDISQQEQPNHVSDHNLIVGFITDINYVFKSSHNEIQW